MRIYTNFIPPSQIAIRQKVSQKIPEQSIIQTLDIYEEALPYIECQMRNTIRHEAAHRADEEQGRPEGMMWEEWTSEGRAEPIAEKAESEDCIRPESVSGVISVNTDEVFQKAKNASGIDPSYMRDVKAAILPDNILGMYQMQDVPGKSKKQPGWDTFIGWDGSQYINVARFFKEWTASDSNKTFPSNIQDDGMESDPDLRNIPGYRQQFRPPAPSGVPSAAIPSIPAVPSVGAR